MRDSVFKLKKVDFFWINRDQRSFEWFLGMLNSLEEEQRVEVISVDVVRSSSVVLGQETTLEVKVA